jgi:hypothetical protein
MRWSSRRLKKSEIFTALKRLCREFRNTGYSASTTGLTAA